MDAYRLVADSFGNGGFLVDGVFSDSSGDYFGGTSAATAVFVRDNL
jgi:hypothetical protein